MDEPTNEQVAEMAQAAFNAAKAKAVELGLDPVAGVLGIERAYIATERSLNIMAALGAGGVEALASIISKAEKYDMHKEAEEAINGD